MRKIIFLLLFFISANSFAQEGFFKVPAKFYTTIDSLKTLKCCDSNFYALALIYEIPLYELPYSEIDLKDYIEKQTEEGYIDSYIQNLIDSYYDMKPSIRNKITKSCYKLNTEYKITKDETEENFYWIEGTLKIKIMFQSDDPNFFKPWWKKLFKSK